MRVCLVSIGDAVADVRARVLANDLLKAGHEVSVVSGGSGQSDLDDRIDVIRVPGRYPRGGGRAGSIVRRMQPERMRRLLYERALTRAAIGTGAETFYPTSLKAMSAAIRSADSVRGAVARRPEWGDAGPRDLVNLAPGSLRWSSSPAGQGSKAFTPDDKRRASSPEMGRHEGKEIVLVYSGAETSPGRYIEDALRRASVATRVETKELDWNTVEQSTDAVLIVESPYPTFEIVGENPGVPVLFWVHHGEHHLAANLRLVDRYGADAVLLAHSWHLAQRFRVSVHRFPFGYAPWLMESDIPYSSRPIDVAMVGAHVDGDAAVYSRRRELVDAARSTAPADRLAFESDVDTKRMAEVYAQARIVINDGGTRHYPITMRVFEAIGSGALLLTDDLPGTAQLFKPDDHYRVVDDDVAGQIGELVSQVEDSSVTAAAALEHAKRHHTYDHRIDELLDIASSTVHSRRNERALDPTSVAAIVDRDVDVQRVAAFSSDGLAEDLPTREVWVDKAAFERLGPNSFDAVVIGDCSGVPVEQVLDSATRVAYLLDPYDGLEAHLAMQAPQAEVTMIGDVTRVDFLADGYRTRQNGKIDTL